MKNENDIVQKYSTIFSDFEKNKKKNPVISHSSCYLGSGKKITTLKFSEYYILLIKKIII